MNKMMKEAPEKIYIPINNTIEPEFLEDYWVEFPISGQEVEYTCTNAFIEKAVKFLKEWDAYRICLEGHKDWFIEQFKKYMEG